MFGLTLNSDDSVSNAMLTMVESRLAMKAPAQPPGLPEGLLEALPDAPGLYLFHAQPEPPPPLGARDPALFVGRAQSLRARVREHFGANNETK